jgi:hypothetical protein
VPRPCPHHTLPKLRATPPRVPSSQILCGSHHGNQELCRFLFPWDTGWGGIHLPGDPASHPVPTLVLRGPALPVGVPPPPAAPLWAPCSAPWENLCPLLFVPAFFSLAWESGQAVGQAGHCTRRRPAGSSHAVTFHFPLAMMCLRDKPPPALSDIDFAIRTANCFSKRFEPWLVLVAHACNPSYLGGSGQEDRGSRPARPKKKQDPISKKNQTQHTNTGLAEWLKW